MPIRPSQDGDGTACTDGGQSANWCGRAGGNSGYTLTKAAEAAECTRSYLSQIENDRREKPPSQALLERLESALRFVPSTLTTLALWEVTPGAVKRQVEDLRDEHVATRAIAREVAELVDRDAIDAADRSGRLRELVERLAAPSDETPGSPLPTGSTDTRRLAVDAPAPVSVFTLLPRRIPIINTVLAGYAAESTDSAFPVARRGGIRIRSGCDG